MILDLRRVARIPVRSEGSQLRAWNNQKPQRKEAV